MESNFILSSFRTANRLARTLCPDVSDNSVTLTLTTDSTAPVDYKIRQSVDRSLSLGMLGGFGLGGGTKKGLKCCPPPA